MRRLWRVVAGITAALVCFALGAFVSLGLYEIQENSAANQGLARPIALTRAQVADLYNGRGGRFGWTADLNGHPAPEALLELKEKLSLSADQIHQLQQISFVTEPESRTLGLEILEKETHLSVNFAVGVITEGSLKEEVQAMADLYGRLRLLHLRAHLRAHSVLSTSQAQRLKELRRD